MKEEIDQEFEDSVWITIHLSSTQFTERAVSSDEYDPDTLLLGLLMQDWDWDIDFSGASEGEAMRWRQVDMMSRVVRALRHGRTVRVIDQKYQSGREAREFIKTLAQVEDAVDQAGCQLVVESDNENGLVIVAGDLINAVQ